MATMAKNRTITVDIVENAGGQISFFLKDNGNGPATQEIKFENDEHPGFIVYFKIRDLNRTGLRFRPDPEDALWVKVGTQNPPAGSHWPGFIPLSVENEGKKLIVYCRNKLPKEKFKFTLRFARSDGSWEDYDPIGDGLNGPRGSFS